MCVCVFICGVYFVIICSSSLLPWEGRECGISWVSSLICIHDDHIAQYSDTGKTPFVVLATAAALSSFGNIRYGSINSRDKEPIEHATFIDLFKHYNKHQLKPLGL